VKSGPRQGPAGALPAAVVHRAIDRLFRLRDPTDIIAYVCYENENRRRSNGSDHHQFALE
jgi:hypothetical protein